LHERLIKSDAAIFEFSEVFLTCLPWWIPTLLNCRCCETELLLPDREQEGGPIREELSSKIRIGIQAAEIKTRN